MQLPVARRPSCVVVIVDRIMKAESPREYYQDCYTEKIDKGFLEGFVARSDGRCLVQVTTRSSSLICIGEHKTRITVLEKD
jgi:hypothetical protein